MVGKTLNSPKFIESEMEETNDYYYGDEQENIF